MAAVWRGPGAPLYAIYRPEVAVFICPFVPDTYSAFLQPFHIGLTAQEPQELDNDGTQVKLFGRHQRETLAQIEPHLVAEYRPCAGSRSIAFLVAMHIHMAHQIFILLHGKTTGGRQASTILMECVISAVRPSMAEAEQYFS